jgi:SAM-dependent methyltransferase
MTNRYYADTLSAERLKRCYEIAPPRVRQYLAAEIDFALDSIRSGDIVLDLGCGYGRTMRAFARKAGFVVGIDTSRPNLLFGRSYLRSIGNGLLLEMDAATLAFPDGTFDVAVCIQNGISAFGRDPLRLFEESLRVVKPGGKALFSTYAEEFWDDRLDWFRRQSAEGLLGEIDEDRTGAGVIVCRDGFSSAKRPPQTPPENHQCLPLPGGMSLMRRACSRNGPSGQAGGPGDPAGASRRVGGGLEESLFSLAFFVAFRLQFSPPGGNST